MFKVVEQVCDDKTDILSEIAAFQTAYNQFKAIIAQISETQQFRTVPLTGITADKSADRTKLCKTIAPLAGFIYAYASATKNQTLKAEVNLATANFCKCAKTNWFSPARISAISAPKT